MDNPGFLESLINLVRGSGAEGVLVLGIWLVITGKLRLEREYLDMREQRDEWHEEYDALRDQVEETKGVAERAVRSEVH